MRYLVFILFFLSSNLIKAQSEFFHFNNQISAGSATINPAFLPRYGFTISFHTKSQFSPGQIPLRDIFNSNVSANNTLRGILNDSTRDLKNINFDSEIGLLEIGFRSRKSYIHASSRILVGVDLNLDKDLFGLLFLGNGDTQYYNKKTNINLGGTDFRLTAQHRLSYGRRLSNKLYFGVNATVIHGLARFRINEANFDMITDPDSNSIYRVAVNGNMDATSVGFKGSIYKPYSPFEYIMKIPFVNYGISGGFGIIYRPIDFLRLSFSTDNHGTTEWNNFVNVHRLKVNFNFKGIDTIGILPRDPNRSVSQDLKDTIKSWYSIYENDVDQKEVSQLTPRYIFGVEYLGIAKHRLSFIYGTGLGMRSNITAYSFSDHIDFNKYVQCYIGYNYISSPHFDHIWNTGFSMHRWGMQLYAQINNLQGFLNPTSVNQYYAAELGVNINFVQNFDDDGDDIPNHRDLCPETYGTMKYKGCPDYTFKQPHIYDPKTKKIKKIKRIEERDPTD